MNSRSRRFSYFMCTGIVAGLFSPQWLTTNVSYAAGCTPPSSRPKLTARPGFAEFMTADRVDEVTSLLPKVTDPQLQQAFESKDTMWYDEHSMEFLYQDSIESVVGLRANCVGRRVGETNPNNPGIFKLVNYFGPDYRFRFPFRTAAGTDDITNVVAFQFWVPPTKDGKRLPVKYWGAGQRKHWYWTFPNGTLFGEVLFQKDAAGVMYPFEVRTRLRYSGGWAVQAFRPFPTATSLANYIMQESPNWQANPQQTAYVKSLLSKETLIPAVMESKPYEKVFPKVTGALDPLPASGDDELIKHALQNVPFQPVEGHVWKRSGTLETYAPSSAVQFNIVPKGYKMGLIPVNEVSCERCHNAVTKELKMFEFDIQLYGEVWGGDRIFTWHPFQNTNYMYGTFDDAENPHKKINPRLITAGLIQNGKPQAGDPLYSPIKE